MLPQSRLALIIIGICVSGVAEAYTAAGDRLFPATILLPQIAPSDELYLTGVTQPDSGGRESSFTMNYDKTITERCGAGFSEGYNWIGATGVGTRGGWQDVSLIAQCTPIVDAEHEFLISIGGERVFGGTGTARAGSTALGSTMPTIYIGKGLGDAALDMLRPVAIAGILGYTLGDTASQGDDWTAGIALEYSIPYLESKVGAFAVPDALRAVTPMVEFLVTTPAQRRAGNATAATVAPGFEYAGNGWELGAEAFVPLTRSSGQGLGFSIQLHLALDYLFPDSIGKPLLGG